MSGEVEVAKILVEKEGHMFGMKAIVFEEESEDQLLDRTGHLLERFVEE